MKCSKCGYKLKDDMIFCPRCGKEIHMVPEFVPEIEISIEESLSKVADEIGDGTGSLPVNEIEDEDKDTGFFLFFKDLKNGNRTLYTYIAVVLTILLVLIIYVAVMVYHDNSATYQIKKGDKAAAEGRYKQAVEYYTKASDIDPDSSEPYIKTAECYESTGSIELAIESYIKVIENTPDSTLAYSKVIDLYKSMDAYGDIDAFLKANANDDIKDAFSEYLAYAPEFSHDDGSYSEAIVLTLTGGTGGKIYYTEDGSEPDTGSEVYDEPLYLKKGTHTINAIYVNQYGVTSPVMSHTYNILAQAPSAPIVSLESGEYDRPQIVRVIVPEDCSVYYTLDGQDPDSTSRIYGEPIPVSDGLTVFKFVAINSRGVKSEVAQREYTVKIASNFTPEIGLSWLNTHLMLVGYLLDTQGSSAYFPGKFSYLYSDMRYIAGRTLYCYNEYYVLGSGVRSMTNNVFGIDCNTGEVFLVKKLSNDEYSISAF